MGFVAAIIALFAFFLMVSALSSGSNRIAVQSCEDQIKQWTTKHGFALLTIKHVTPWMQIYMMKSSWRSFDVSLRDGETVRKANVTCQYLWFRQSTEPSEVSWDD